MSSSLSDPAPGRASGVAPPLRAPEPTSADLSALHIDPTMTRPPIVAPVTMAPRPATDYPAHSIGRLMDPPVAVFLPLHTVGESIEIVRALSRTTRVFTYGYVTDTAGR